MPRPPPPPTDPRRRRIGARIAAARKAAGLTQAAAGERLGCRQPVVAEIEAEAKVSLARLLELADLYGCDPADLVQAADGPTRSELAAALRTAGSVLDPAAAGG